MTKMFKYFMINKLLNTALPKTNIQLPQLNKIKIRTQRKRIKDGLCPKKKRNPWIVMSSYLRNLGSGATLHFRLEIFKEKYTDKGL